MVFEVNPKITPQKIECLWEKKTGEILDISDSLGRTSLRFLHKNETSYRHQYKQEPPETGIKFWFIVYFYQPGWKITLCEVVDLNYEN